PLEQEVRPAAFDRRDESIDKFVIIRTPDAFVTPADIERVFQPLIVFGSNIEKNGQAAFRGYTGERGIERHLANRDAHPTGALVTETKNSFAIAYHNAFDAVI